VFTIENFIGLLLKPPFKILPKDGQETKKPLKTSEKILIVKIHYKKP
jgi:hypothetical protein